MKIGMGICMAIEEILTGVKNGTLSVSQAEELISNTGDNAAEHSAALGYAEMGYAKLDSDRKHGTGYAEVVFCSGKTVEQLRNIYQHILDTEGEVLGTRASKEQYEVLKQSFPDISYDELSHILKIEKADKPHYGNVAMCSAGTADIPVAEEAAQTAEFFGTKVNRIYDVGVSGEPFFVITVPPELIESGVRFVSSFM